MKTNTIARSVTTNATERSEFKATDTAKIFHMLISGLYSDKPQSITREIWSNALDAHVISGQPERPFDVSFPSVFNPVFTVRDYGPAMDHDTVMNIYTNLGMSTKEDTNDEVGKWGIGSKSPFSYTDTFSVTTYIDGTARHYTAVIEKGGIPAMYLMATTKTDEENGLEVSFPVENSDVRSFRRACQRVSYGFDVKPNIVGSDGGEEFEGWTQPDIMNEGAGWKLLRTPLEGYGGTAYARMGCVLYPINVSNIEGLDSDTKEILSTTIVIDFPIGSLEITPSRESLQYGPKDPTSDSIRDRVQSIADEIAEQVKADYAKCRTYWEACVKYNEHLEMDLPEAIKRIIRAHAMWGGDDLETTINLISNRRGDTNVLNFCEISYKKIKNKNVRFEHQATSVTVTAAATTVMIVEDLTLEHKKRSKRAGPRVSLFRDMNRERIKQIIWVKYAGGKAQSEAMIALLEKTDGIEIIDMCDLELPEITRGEYSRRPVQVRIVKSWNHDTRADLSPEEMEDGGYYVPLMRNEPVKPHCTSAPHGMMEVLKRLGAFDADTVLYGVPKTMWKRFEGDQWINIYDAAQEYYDDHACAETIDEAAAVAEGLENYVMQFVSEKIDVSKLDPKSDLLEGIAFFGKIQKIDTSVANAMKNLVSALNKEEDMKTDTPAATRVELDFYVELLTETYPLLDILARQCSYEDNLVDKVTHYAYMCDAAAKTLRIKTAAIAA